MCSCPGMQWYCTLRFFCLFSESRTSSKEQLTTDQQTPLLILTVVWGQDISWRERMGELAKMTGKTKWDFQCSYITMNSSQLARIKLLSLWHLPIMVSFECRLLITYISCSLGRLENTFASMISKASFCEISLKNKWKVKIFQAMLLVERWGRQWKSEKIQKKLVPKLQIHFKKEVDNR